MAERLNTREIRIKPVHSFPITLAHMYIKLQGTRRTLKKKSLKFQRLALESPSMFGLKSV